jgi:hypothetical protein
MLTDLLQDRRDGHRVSAELQARVFRNGRPTTYPVLELSRSGARLATPVGDELPMVFWIELDLPNDGPMRLRARTMWCDGPTSGIRFVDVDEVDSLVLAEGLDELSRES